MSRANPVLRIVALDDPAKLPRFANLVLRASAFVSDRWLCMVRDRNNRLRTFIGETAEDACQLALDALEEEG